MFVHRKLTTIAAVAVLAFGLAACGGGGEDDQTGMTDTCPDGQVGTPPNCTTPEPPPTPSTEQERFDARIAVNEAENAKQAAMTAVADAVTAATTAANEAAKHAENASNAADRAKDARTDADSASKASTMADTHKTTASNAKNDADDAQTALDDAITAYTMAVDGQDINTQDGANAIKRAAEALEMAADEAKIDAETAQGKAEKAKDGAMTAATDAKEAAGMHVLGLFKAANAVGVMDDATTDANEQADAVKAVAAVIGAEAITSDNGAGSATATVDWPVDTAADPDASPPVEAADGMLSFTMQSPDGKSVDFRTEDHPTDDTKKKTATMIDGLSGFMHGYSITDGDQHAIVFTDKMQATAMVPAKTNEDELVNHPVTLSHIMENENADFDSTKGISDLNTKTKYDHDGDPDTKPLSGKYACQAGSDCDFQATGSTIDNIVGTAVFSADAGQELVAAIPADSKEDYLAFGVWLKPDDDDTTDGYQNPAFGAFADGGIDFATPVTLTGTATYDGAATGVYTAGTSVDYFQGDATLTAEFGDAAALGAITGMIDNIVAGGVEMSDEIRLDLSDQDAANADANNIGTNGAFSGRTRMGAGTLGADGEYDYTYTGTWSGQFHGPAAADDAEGVDTLPPAVAGTFGVTGTDDMGTADDTDDDVTHSYVGAFGARR